MHEPLFNAARRTGLERDGFVVLAVPNLSALPRINVCLTYTRAPGGNHRARHLANQCASFPPDKQDVCKV